MQELEDALARVERHVVTSELIAPPAEPHSPSKDDQALIAATIEVRGLNRFPRLQLASLVVLLAAILASATFYLNNSLHSNLGISDSTVFEGTMQPFVDVRVTALEPGIVTFVGTHVGDAVREGDVVVKMDSREARLAVSQAQLGYEAAQSHVTTLRLDLARTEAEVAAASRTAALIPSRQVRDSVQHARAVYELAQIDHTRNEELYNLGIISKQSFDDSSTSLRIAEDDLHNAQNETSANDEVRELQGHQSELLSQISQREQVQQLKEARLALETARLRLSNTEVRTTSFGMVSSVSAKVGDQVSVGAPLIVVSRMDRITVNVPVAASMIGVLHKSQQAKITLPTMPPRQVLGMVRAISPVPSPNMTHTVEVEFDNPTGQLFAGQPARVRFVFQ